MAAPEYVAAVKGVQMALDALAGQSDFMLRTDQQTVILARSMATQNMDLALMVAERYLPDYDSSGSSGNSPAGKDSPTPSETEQPPPQTAPARPTHAPRPNQPQRPR